MCVSRRSAVVLAAAFAALAALVAAGTCTRLDQWGVDHLMPGAHHGKSAPTLLESLVPLLGAHWRGGLAVAAEIVLLPASFLVALALVAWRSRLLAAALVAAVAVEVICKELITRPALYHETAHISPFDTSFPSGHALRTVILAGALWPALRWWAVAWAAAALALLQLAGWHTPTDIAGGVLLGCLALLCARGLRARLARG